MNSRRLMVKQQAPKSPGKKEATGRPRGGAGTPQNLFGVPSPIFFFFLIFGGEKGKA